VAVAVAGAPALLVNTYPGLVVRAAPVAVTVYLPAVVLAVNVGAVAMPDELVVAVLPPQAKVPLAPVVGAYLSVGRKVAKICHLLPPSAVFSRPGMAGSGRTRFGSR